MSEQKVQITIELKDNGDVQVHGPLAAKVLCFGLLEAAKFVVQNYAEAPNPILSLVPTVIPPESLLRN